MRSCSLPDSTVIYFQILVLFALFSCSLSFTLPPMGSIDVCPIVDRLQLCGKGTCEPSANVSATIPFDCKCDPGWKPPPQIFNLTVPTCALPNCTIDNQCSSGSPPKAINPLCPLCLGANCTVNGFLDATCHCEEGYGNLLNNPNFPCFPKCYVEGKCNNGLAAPAPKSSGGTTTTKVSNYSMKTTLDFLVVIMSVTAFLTWV